MKLPDWKPEDWLAVGALLTVCTIMTFYALSTLWLEPDPEAEDSFGEIVFALLALVSTYIGFKLANKNGDPPNSNQNPS